MSAPELTIYDRLVAQIRRSGYRGPLYKWCVAAGLSRGYLSKMHSVCKSGGHPTMDSESVKKIAAALGASAGEILGLETRPSERYPSQAQAIQDAKALGFSDAAIQMGLDFEPGREPAADFGRLWWFKRFEAAEFLLGGNRPSTLMKTRFST